MKMLKRTAGYHKPAPCSKVTLTYHVYYILHFTHTHDLFIELFFFYQTTLGPSKLLKEIEGGTVGHSQNDLPLANFLRMITRRRPIAATCQLNQLETG